MKKNAMTKYKNILLSIEILLYNLVAFCGYKITLAILCAFHITRMHISNAVLWKKEVKIILICTPSAWHLMWTLR